MCQVLRGFLPDPIVQKRELREQAHLPAQQPSPGQDPRFPSSHAHPCRSRHPGRPSAQGSRRAVGLTRLSPVLPAASRLRRRADFTAVLRGRGTVRAGSRLVVGHCRCTDSLTPRGPRVGFVVSKAVGGAVTRNLVKRRLRASVARQLATVPPGCDLVLRANPPAATATYAELDAAVSSVLRRVRPAGDRR